MILRLIPDAVCRQKHLRRNSKSAVAVLLDTRVDPRVLDTHDEDQKLWLSVEGLAHVVVQRENGIRDVVWEPDHARRFRIKPPCCL